MFEQDSKRDCLLVLQEIDSSPLVTQRVLSSKLDISLGKTNQLICQLIKRGLVEAMSFKKTNTKTKKVRYALTVKGKKEREDLVYNFLKLKESEFVRLRTEWERIQKEQTKGKSEQELSLQREQLLPYLYRVVTAKKELNNIL
jgi:DNA-binding MarR family transcriptional regulator